MRWLGALAVVACACGSSAPQQRDEAAVVFRAAFTAEAGVNTQVIFPMPDDAAKSPIMSSVYVSDGGVVTFVNTNQGLGVSLEGKGTVEATFAAKAVKGYASGETFPEATLSRQVPDAGTAVHSFDVNKGGSAVAQVDFEYTASRDCGPGCGGTRGWTYAGPVGLALQPITMTYLEEKR